MPAPLGEGWSSREMAPDVPQDTAPSWTWSSSARLGLHMIHCQLSRVTAGCPTLTPGYIDSILQSLKNVLYSDLADPNNPFCSTLQITKHFGILHLVCSAHVGTMKAWTLKMLTDVCETKRHLRLTKGVAGWGCTTRMIKSREISNMGLVLSIQSRGGNPGKRLHWS